MEQTRAFYSSGTRTPIVLTFLAHFMAKPSWTDETWSPDCKQGTEEGPQGWELPVTPLKSLRPWCGWGAEAGRKSLEGGELWGCARVEGARKGLEEDGVSIPDFSCCSPRQSKEQMGSRASSFSLEWYS